MNALSAALSAGYFLVFNLTYSLAWFLSVLLFKPVLRLAGSDLPRHYTDIWATGWGVGLLRGGFFLSRARIHLEIDDEIRSYDGPFLVVMNHQATFDIAVAFYVLWKVGRRRMRWVLKKELLKAPLVRQACLETKCAFVDRRDRGQAAMELKRFAADLRRDQASGVIFVEGTRATPEKLRNSSLEHLLDPKPFGFGVLHDELPGWPILSVTINWHEKEGVTVFGTGIWKALLRIECKMHRPEEIPGDGTEWLRRTEWPRRDAVIAQWKGEFAAGRRA